MLASLARTVACDERLGKTARNTRSGSDGKIRSSIARIQLIVAALAWQHIATSATTSPPELAQSLKQRRNFIWLFTDDSTNVARIYGSIGVGLVLSRYCDNKKGREPMTDRAEEIRYLRRKARQFRELAGKYQTEISPKLYEIAVELEQRADELERQKD